MKKTGEIEITIIGKSGNIDLTPDNFDIKHIASILQNVEDLLHPANKKERPLITYNIQEGSVKNIFKTTLQTIIGFSAVLTQIQASNSIDFLELKSARAIENIQEHSIQKNYEYHIKTTESDTYELKITPQTKFYRTENIWVDAELYLYGMLKNAGGKNKANIHIDTEDYGYIAIETGQDFLQRQKDNFLYKKFGVRAKAKQNIETGEIDTKSLKLIELIDYDPKYDENYLNKLISKAKNNWKNIDADKWLYDFRGNYEI
ncbi:MAG: hypothetical protein U9Q83_07765 [Bacteroidota bacterium]|nr:hypothetical protein [Bacteroidota bacterium]